MPKRFYEIFRAGNYPQGNFDEQDIQDIAENYDPSFLEAPITIDHSWGGRAFGWIEELKAEGERLLATFKDVSDHLKCMVATKAYKRHSIELFNDLDGRGPYLKALSMLGATPPQVKGMEPITFSAEDYPSSESTEYELDEPIDPGEMEFSELAKAWLEVLDTSVEEFRNQCGFSQDMMAGLVEGQFDEEVDEETRSRFNDLMRQLQEEEFNDATADQMKNFITEQFSEDDDSATDDSEESDQFDEEELAEKSFSEMTEAEREYAYSNMRERAQTLENELEQERDEKKSFASENEKIKFQQRKNEFVSFLDKNIKDQPKLPPKLKDTAVALFEHLDGMGAEEEDEQSPLELFKEIIEGLPVIDLDDTEFNNAAPVDMSDPKSLAKQIEQYQQEQKKQGNTVSASEALTHIKNQRK